MNPYMNPFDPYGLYTDPNQFGVGKNIIGANKNMAPQQPVGLLGIQPRQIPHAKFEEEQVNGAGFKMAADAFMKNKNPATDYALSAGGVSDLGFKMPQLAQGTEMMPSFNFEPSIGLKSPQSGLGLFLNKYF